MPREARVVVPDVPHHITSRGIRGSDVFRDDDDRVLFTSLIEDSCAKFGVLIRSYAWMTNHDHMIAIPRQPDSFAKAFRRANSIYARCFNKKYGLLGYLWQDRFYSCPLDERHFWSAMRYVELNPVRAGMVARAEDYIWSSARAHCRGEFDRILDPNWNAPDFIPKWREWLNSSQDAGSDDTIRENTRTGRPCGNDLFVRQMEQLLGRILRPLRRGPRPKAKAEAGGQLILHNLR